MQINNPHQAAQMSGVEASKFGFEMNAKMYDILISKMYTNKPAAVIRELSANAWDAHVEAGNEDKPFDLHLPTWLDKTFYIRDYGTGIPHDKFEHIYTNVGASTKEDTNDLIGGFGLGSKTPFTMTDTFMVENHCNGVKTTWICFKDKGEPNVSKVAEAPSTAPSGLKVSFSFDDGDVPEFTKQVPKQLRFFPVKPKITGGEGKVEFAELPDGWETQDYFYSTNDDWRTRANYVVMGNVAYKLDSNEFDYNYRTLFNKGLTIKVPIGAVDIPPSREHLEMTQRTKRAILSVLDKIRGEYLGDLQARISKCKNEFDLRKVVYDANGDLVRDPSKLKWNGREINWNNLRRGYLSVVGGYPVRNIQRRYANVYRGSTVNMRTIIDGKAKFYVMDLGQGFSKYINEEYGNHDTSNMAIVHVSPSPKDTYDARVQQAIKDTENEVGVKPLLLSSVFGKPVVKPKVPKSPKDKNRAEPSQVFRIKGGNGESPCGSEDTPLKYLMDEQTDLPQDAYYMELSNWSIITKIPEIRRLLQWNLLHYLDKPVYLVRTKSIPKLHKSMTLLTIDILEEFKDDIVTHHKKLENFRKLQLSMHRVTQLQKLIIPALKDKQIAAYVRYAAYVLKQTEGFRGDPNSIHRVLFKKSIDYTPVLNPKVKTLVDKYDPIHNLVYQITTGWNKQLNETNMKTFVKLITQ